MDYDYDLPPIVIPLLQLKQSGAVSFPAHPSSRRILTPSGISVIGYPGLPGDYSDGGSLAEHDLSFS